MKKGTRAFLAEVRTWSDDGLIQGVRTETLCMEWIEVDSDNDASDDDAVTVSR